MTVRTTLPLIGLVGIDGVMEVRGHAAVEQLAVGVRLRSEKFG